MEDSTHTLEFLFMLNITSAIIQNLSPNSKTSSINPKNKLKKCIFDVFQSFSHSFCNFQLFFLIVGVFLKKNKFKKICFQCTHVYFVILGILSNWRWHCFSKTNQNKKNQKVKLESKVNKGLKYKTRKWETKT
jgi:hypothetical protein